MSNRDSAIEVEYISASNISMLTEMTLELWPECDFEEELESWKEISNDAGNYCVLAKSNNQYAGFIHVAIRNDYVEGADFGKTAYVEGLFVKKSYRNNGIASLLLQHAEEWVKSKGIRQIASDTEVGNLNSQLFHKKAGFEEVNRIVCFLKNI